MADIAWQTIPVPIPGMNCFGARAKHHSLMLSCDNDAWVGSISPLSAIEQTGRPRPSYVGPFSTRAEAERALIVLLEAARG